MVIGKLQGKALEAREGLGGNTRPFFFAALDQTIAYPRSVINDRQLQAGDLRVAAMLAPAAP